MTAPHTGRCVATQHQGRRVCSCRAGELPVIDLDVTSSAKPRRGGVKPRTRFVLRHPTLVTCVLLVAILGAWLLASSWDQQALLGQAPASADCGPTATHMQAAYRSSQPEAS